MKAGAEEIVLSSDDDDFVGNNTIISIHSDEYFQPTSEVIVLDDNMYKNSQPKHTARSSEVINLSGLDPTGFSAESKVAEIDRELEAIEIKINNLQELKDQLISEKECLLSTYMLNTNKADHSHTSLRSKEVNSKYSSTGFPWDEKLMFTLKTVWGIDKLRLNQLSVINATMSNKDTMVIMPTGGGKSLCYQLPAAIEQPGSFTVVITPLISLIKDQLLDLAKFGVPATGLFGSPTKEHRNAITQILEDKKGKNAIPEPWKDLGLDEPFRLLYITPEQIVKSTRLLKNLKSAYIRKKLKRFVIDECHCCSQFGHDFRPDYKKLGVLKNGFPETPILALTATCSPSVMSSVQSILGIQGCLLFKSPLYRPNLRFSVISKPANIDKTIDVIVELIKTRHPKSTGIIYCLSRNDTEKVSAAINQLSNNTIRSRPYHAYLEEEEKHRIHTDWRRGAVQVVVATIAFGLGINHPDVRFVIHHTASKALDGYYQESGRAGRDGLPSDCILLCRGQDSSRIFTMAVEEQGGLEQAFAMMSYALCKTQCRMKMMVNYFSKGRVPLPLVDTQPITFGEDACGVCDNCQNLAKPLDIHDCTSVALTILHLLASLIDKVTCLQLVNMLPRSNRRNPIPESLSALKDRPGMTIPFPPRYIKLSPAGLRIVQHSPSNFQVKLCLTKDSDWKDWEDLSTKKKVRHS